MAEEQMKKDQQEKTKKQVKEQNVKCDKKHDDLQKKLD